MRMIEGITFFFVYKGISKLWVTSIKLILIGALVAFAFIKIMPYIFLLPIPLVLYFDSLNLYYLPQFTKKVVTQVLIFIGIASASAICIVSDVPIPMQEGKIEPIYIVWIGTLLYLLFFLVYTTLSYRKKLSEAKYCMQRFFISRNISAAKKKLKSLKKKYGSRSQEYTEAFDSEIKKILNKIKEHKKNIKFFKTLTEKELEELFIKYKTRLNVKLEPAD